MTGQPEPLVSVVTPFYNTDKYLAECIESILSQTYQNWEYLLVDNCSTDRSAEIARRYAEKEKRIRLLHNDTFLTQVQNYNHALRQINPESRYCKIVQADDWIFPECLARMVTVAEKDASIGIVAGYRLQGKRITNDGLPYEQRVFSGREACRANLLLDGSQIFGSPTTILLRTEIIKGRDPFYSENDLFEDTDACFEVLQTWNFGFVYQVVAFERVDDECISSQIASFDPVWFLAKIIRVKKFGPIYLEPLEYKQRFRSIESAYFHYLARNVILGREEAFWNYHRQGLASVGYELKNSLLKKYIFLEITDMLFNPKAAVGRLWQKLRSRGRR